jgi:hypothetical protein
MEEKLKKFIENLKGRPAFQFNVIDCVSEKSVAQAINQDFLNKNFSGNLVEYLESLRKKGFQKIQLVPRLKNGSTSKPGGPSITVDFNVPASTSQNNVAAIPPQMQIPTGLNGSFGLGMPEIMDGYAAKRENEMLKQQIRQLQEDYKEERESKRRWREKATKFERENERHVYKEDIQREPSALDKLIDGIAQNPAMIPSLIGAFKGSGGLNAPQHQQAELIDPLENYSEMQRALCETIGQMPDTLCNDLAEIISRIAEPDKEFIQGLKKLLTNPHLKKAE